MTLKELIAGETYGDWTNALAAADESKLSPDTEVMWTREGENDGPGWQAIFRVSPTSFLAIHAWCDYTGWDCQSGGDSKEFESESDARVWLDSQ